MKVLLNKTSSIQAVDSNKFQATIALSDALLPQADIEEGSTTGRGYQLLYFKGDKTEYTNGGASFQLDQSVFEDMVRNFESKVTGQDLAVNYSHDAYGEAAGWIERVYLGEDQKALLVDINWTPAGLQKVRDKEFRYLSAEFYTKRYSNSESDQEFSNVLTGCALTNIPFLKRTEVKLSEGRKPMQKEEMVALLKQDHEIDVLALQEQKASLQVQLSDTQVKLSEAQAKLEEIQSLQRKDKLESLYSLALSEGKVVPAQKEMFSAWVSGFELSEAEAVVAKMPQVVALNVQKSESVGEEKSVDFMDRKSLHELALSHQNKTGVSYEVAYNEVKRQGGR